VRSALRGVYLDGLRCASVLANSNEGEAWGLVQWAVTFFVTSLVSVGAFVWRLLARIDRLEANYSLHRDEIEAMRNANDATMLRLAERFAQLHDDHFKLRETMGAMPTRSDLRELEDRLAARLSALSDRIDRVIDA
jgi:hypothetical protein